MPQRGCSFDSFTSGEEAEYPLGVARRDAVVPIAELIQLIGAERTDPRVRDLFARLGRKPPGPRSWYVAPQPNGVSFTWDGEPRQPKRLSAIALYVADSVEGCTWQGELPLGLTAASTPADLPRDAQREEPSPPLDLPANLAPYATPIDPTEVTYSIRTQGIIVYATFCGGRLSLVQLGLPF